jgi:hypothetical protein
MTPATEIVPQRMNESLLSDFRVQVEWVQKLHSRDELKRRFVDRTFEETFDAIGRKLDPEAVNPAFLGYELLTESKRLEEKHYWFYGD